MMTSELAVRPLISARESEKMIWAFVFHGEHDQREAMKGSPKSAIERWFAENDQPLRNVIARCRTFSRAVPFLENFAGSTFYSSSGEGGESVLSMYKSGKSEPEVEVVGAGSVGVDYVSKFESACRSRDRTISTGSYDELDTTIIKGVSAIEAYISHREWNETELLDEKRAKVSFEDKIKSWIPTMTNGKKLDLSGTTWQDFLFLQKIRDGAVHSKQFARGASFLDLAGGLNKFKTGVAKLTFDLHVMFEEPVPRSVIRAMFFPEVYVPTVKS
jgi:hypothetical protein